MSWAACVANLQLAVMTTAETAAVAAAAAAATATTTTTISRRRQWHNKCPKIGEHTSQIEALEADNLHWRSERVNCARRQWLKWLLLCTVYAQSLTELAWPKERQQTDSVTCVWATEEEEEEEGRQQADSS